MNGGDARCGIDEVGGQLKIEGIFQKPFDVCLIEVIGRQIE